MSTAGSLMDWIGRQYRVSDVVDAWRIRALAAVLDLPPDERVLPGSHWLHCRDLVEEAALGSDGHPERGRLLPPVPLPRRMWAGSRIRFAAPLLPGTSLDRITVVEAIREKQTDRGEMLFLTLRHAWYCDAVLAIEEQQDLVYLAAGGSPRPRCAPAGEVVSRHRASTAQVFRYSALTFNAHRIHYDLPYARDVEGYAGIVVQGPLLATRLATAIEARHGRLARLDFRLVAPTVVDEEYRCCLGGERAWIEGADGSLRMEAGFAVDTP